MISNPDRLFLSLYMCLICCLYSNKRYILIYHIIYAQRILAQHHHKPHKHVIIKVCMWQKLFLHLVVSKSASQLSCHPLCWPIIWLIPLYVSYRVIVFVQIIMTRAQVILTQMHAFKWCQRQTGVWKWKNLFAIMCTILFH